MGLSEDDGGDVPMGISVQFLSVTEDKKKNPSKVMEQLRPGKLQECSQVICHTLITVLMDLKENSCRMLVQVTNTKSDCRDSLLLTHLKPLKIGSPRVHCPM